jgi:hypothetical protein
MAVGKQSNASFNGRFVTLRRGKVCSFEAPASQIRKVSKNPDSNQMENGRVFLHFSRLNQRKAVGVRFPI